MDCIEVVNMYKYLTSVIEHNLKESWKSEKQFNFLCIRWLATEVSFLLHFSFPQMAFCSILPFFSPLYHQFLYSCDHWTLPVCVTTYCACLNGQVVSAPGIRCIHFGEALGSACLNLMESIMCADKLGVDSREWLLIWLSGQELRALLQRQKTPLLLTSLIGLSFPW